MQVPLTAYAEDCSFTGELALTADRLSDFLTSTVEFAVENVVFRALEDGHVLVADTAAILRSDLCAVLAGEPRGREELRTWTRQFPVLAHVGPYRVHGYLHAPPTVDPLKMAGNRAILALTSGTITYAEAGADVEVAADTVLVNSARIERLEPATTEDFEADALDEPDPVTGPDAAAADMPAAESSSA